ncbi:MAG TPA: alpha/beta hydrolase [Myxococcales bacterium]|jgi:pimeloyl-ACP methyl ester carboxylesterase
MTGSGARGAFEFQSADGTKITGWRSGGDGPSLVLSPGLGTPPEAWPLLIRPDSGFSVTTFFYRGTGGSERPADRSRIRIEDHLSDLVALLDHERIDRALVAGWSIGVNLAFELARQQPDRVLGLLSVAGIPGGSLGSFFAPVGVPKPWRRTAAVAVCNLARALGPGLSALARGVPKVELLASVIAHTGFMLPQARPATTLPALTEFFRNDFRWYFELALAAGEHPAMDVSFLKCPTTVVAGKRDSLTAHEDVVALARRIPQALLVELPGSHFLPLEYPEEMLRLARELAQRVAAEPGAAAAG